MSSNTYKAARWPDGTLRYKPPESPDQVTIREMNAEVARLREALEFYTGWPLQDDEGERARAALGEGSP